MRLDPVVVATVPSRPASLPDASHQAGLPGAWPLLRERSSITVRHPERLGREHRLHNSREFAAVKAGATAFRGRCILLLVLPCPGEPTRVGLVASKRSVGGAVQRNRARRRLREILRRRWARVAAHGYWMMFIAARAVLDAPHERLAAEVEGLLTSAGILAAAEVGGR